MVTATCFSRLHECQCSFSSSPPASRKNARPAHEQLQAPPAPISGISALGGAPSWRPLNPAARRRSLLEPRALFSALDASARISSRYRSELCTLLCIVGCESQLEGPWPGPRIWDFWDRAVLRKCELRFAENLRCKQG